ncbi:MAG: redox-regulated ATPase YchF [Saprospiraceae bacterium]|jgi:GTP-binding protein YchF|nr:redox-regulated ATPase YchF [Saprospiraceae bacterium]MCA0332507.1 redox-regulated ATPase YchF [Bacteroidota bacterium]MCB0603303.1 redox-regulated ATPase YchF [Saprospiraceae bacterium]MCO5276849.1 redox-regulated ATPase YchF [Saprospiraceae bacterium]HMT77376.1 redox-regulated ATPase YchF [Saprospiraceae bacterium]
MALKCGIVGLPNVGKSTLFNALTSAKALAANYPFATKEPNLGIITVPDVRLDQLSDIVQPQKVQPTTVEILDIAGLIKGASKGEGLGNQFLANIREVDAIIHVIRCFQDDNVVHVDGSINPVRDKDVIDTELQLKDIETLEKRIDKLQKSAKTGDKAAKATFDLGQKLLTHLEGGNNARSFEASEEELIEISEFQLLTFKPILYVCNVDEGSAITGNEYSKTIEDLVKTENAEVVLISAGIEADIAELETKEERQEFLEAIGLSEPGVNKIISAAYKLLGLITYFTAGVKEVRAWTIKEGTKAPGAAGVIHTDFEKGFIRAEVIGYNDYITLGSEAAVKEAGKMGVEGKEYVVKDGDIMHFRFNV